MYKGRLDNKFKSEREIAHYCRQVLSKKRFFISGSSMGEYKKYCTLNMGEVLGSDLGKMKVQWNKIDSDKGKMEMHIRDFGKNNVGIPTALINWCRENQKINYSHRNALTGTLMREWCYDPKKDKPN